MCIENFEQSQKLRHVLIHAGKIKLRSNGRVYEICPRYVEVSQFRKSRFITVPRRPANRPDAQLLESATVV